MNSTRFLVKCDDYVVVCKSREEAERRLAGIEAAGNCQQPHSIVEVPR